jgi:hypothetical protein
MLVPKTTLLESLVFAWQRNLALGSCKAPLITLWSFKTKQIAAGSSGGVWCIDWMKVEYSVNPSGILDFITKNWVNFWL